MTFDRIPPIAGPMMKAAETILSNRDNHELRIDTSVTSATTLFNNYYSIIITLERE